MAIGNRLKQLLKERNITVKDFAHKIGVPPTTLYSFIKRDSQSAKMDLIVKICEGLNIGIQDLIGIKETINDENVTVFDFTGMNNEDSVDAAIFLQNEVNKDRDQLNNYTLAAHFTGDEYTEEELEEIKQFAEFIKSRRSVLDGLEDMRKNLKIKDLKFPDQPDGSGEDNEK